jgi:hypothetical protein
LRQTTWSRAQEMGGGRRHWTAQHIETTTTQRLWVPAPSLQRPTTGPIVLNCGTPRNHPRTGAGSAAWPVHLSGGAVCNTGAVTNARRTGAPAQIRLDVGLVVAVE